jgi:hypothetical protein
MPSLINSDDGVVSGSAGIKTTGSNDGLLNLQSNGSTIVAITGSGISVTGTVTQTGVSTFAAGTAAAPAITFTGDTNTGIYSPGADRIGFAEGGTQVGEFDASGNFLFNSGYGSAAIAYGCRAWVNFQGNANTSLSGTYSQSGTTVTVTATAHGLSQGNAVYADITTGTGVDGVYTVATVTDANTFTYTAGTSLTTSGNITLTRNTIRASGNVSSIADIATGEYIINFTTAMPDANYSVSGCQGGGNNYALRTMEDFTARTASLVRVYCVNASFNPADPPQANFAIFR